MKSELGEWVKIAEIEKSSTFWSRSSYSKYAIMEMICYDGMRKYKEVHMCTYTNMTTIKDN